MDIQSVKDYCLSLAGSSIREEAAPYNRLVYLVGNKPFAYFKTSEPEQWRFSIRVSTESFIELTDQAGIKPARYMHRFYWITVVDVGAVNSEYLTQWIDYSYYKALNRLSKKMQLALVTPATNN